MSKEGNNLERTEHNWQEIVKFSKNNIAQYPEAILEIKSFWTFIYKYLPSRTSFHAFPKFCMLWSAINMYTCPHKHEERCNWQHAFWFSFQMIPDFVFSHSIFLIGREVINKQGGGRCSDIFISVFNKGTSLFS